MLRGWITSSTLISSGILRASSGTSFSSKLRFSSDTSTHGSVGCCLVMGLSERPITGSPLSTPTTGFLIAATCAIARVMSYSIRRSRSGASTGIAAFWSRKETASPR